MANIRKRLEQDWQMDHYQTPQFMTGPGACEDSTWLRRTGDSEPRCADGEKCPLQEENRRDLRKTLQRRNLEWRKANFARTTRKPPRCSAQSLRAKVGTKRSRE